MNIPDIEILDKEAKILQKYGILYKGEKLFGESMENYLRRIMKILEKRPEFFINSFKNQKTLLGKINEDLMKETIMKNLISNQETTKVSISEDLVDKKIVDTSYNLEKSLQPWFDYVLSKESNYSISAKYWIKEGISFYNGRSKNSINIFPIFNQQALDNIVYIFNIFNEIVELEDKKGKLKGKEELTKNKKRELNFEIEQKLSEMTNFCKSIGLEDGKIPNIKNKKLSQKDFTFLYEQSLKSLPDSKENHFHITDGEWREYTIKDILKMMDDLKYFDISWCIKPSYYWAEKYLSDGRIFIYYTHFDELILGDEGNNNNLKPCIPRIAICEEHGSIGEIKGVANDQEMDDYIINTDILGKKLIQEFGDKEYAIYEKMISDTKKLTEIFNNYFLKIQKKGLDEKFIWKKPEITKEELDFIFSNIKTFGNHEDFRILKICNGIAENISDYKVYEVYLVKKLILKGYSDILFKNFEKFTCITERNHLGLANNIIDNFYGDLVAENFEKFTGIDKKEHLDLVYKIMYNSLFGESVIENFEKFTGINKKEHLDLVYEMIENGLGFYVVKNFEKFTGIKKDMHLSLFYKIIDYKKMTISEINLIKDNIHKFTGLNTENYEKMLDGLIKVSDIDFKI